MVELIITEKPNAAKRIADALADGKAIKENKNGVPFYKVTHGNKDIIVSCAVGHLYGLAQKKGQKAVFPAFDVEWRPSSEKKKSAFSAKYLNVIKSLAKQVDEFTVATDFDIEGEVIGLNIVRFACKKKDANRMKFSTLTKDDLIEAYEHKSKTLAWGQAKAGETRHVLDWYNGINYSRALTSAIKTAGAFKIMSTGRVQGPALKIIVEREREIKKFKPVPYWQIQLLGKILKEDIEAWHKEDKFWEKPKAKKVMDNVKGQKKGKITNLVTKSHDVLPPHPFDLTSLQIESYRTLKISPKETLVVAQELYTSGLISYPRTSSQQLTDKIGYKKIFKLLSTQKVYSNFCGSLIKKSPLVPNNGKKTDPAHPAIYPTGLKASLEGREAKVYDLIVRRFLATFGDKAVRESNTMTIDVNKEEFIARGIRTVVKGWHEIYGPYVNIDETELPKVKIGDNVDVKKITMLDKETQPPKRYTEASIIKELEKRNLGTKATRASIVDTLFQRGYVDGKAIIATDLGIRTIETLEKHAPKIIDEELTRHFEEEMDEIRENKTTPENVLDHAKDSLKEILSDFKKEEKEIGKKLLQAHKETREALTTLGTCPVCKEKDLQIRRGKFGFFAACSGYPECKTTYSLPSNALIKPAKKMCETCNFPLVTAIKRGKRPHDFCLNPHCESKHLEGEAGEHAKAVAKGEVEKRCPQCKEGNLILRTSIYGKFYGCSRYPKCKHTEKIA
ncbi:DNA topoisomerase I [Nanoarchaeota archaeon]